MNLLHHRNALLPACLWLLALWLVSPAMTAEEQFSLVMPRATESLLLDIDRAGSRLVVVGERGHILYSDDTGDTWQQAKVPTRQMLTAVHFPSPKLGWAVGHDGLVLATVDGGEHWVIQRDGLTDQNVINRNRLAMLRARQAALSVAAEQEGNPTRWRGLQKEQEDLALDLEDAEFTMSEPVHTAPLLDIFFIDTLRGYAVGAFNTLLVTADGGDHWQSAAERLDNPDGWHLNSITGDETGRLWLAGEGGLLLHSPDAGDSWQPLDSPYQGSYFGISCAPGCGTLLVHGLQGHAYFSRDGGRNWWRSQLDTSRTLTGGRFLTASHVVLVGDVGTVFESHDGAATFMARSLARRTNLSAAVGAGAILTIVGQGGLHRMLLEPAKP